VSRSAGLTRTIERQPVDVIVGIVRDPADRILIGQRPDGKHMAGSWEFPGGKLEQGEPPVEGLRRELEEEVGIRVEMAEPLIEQRYSYPERDVRLDVWWVLSYSGQVHPRESQALRWVSAGELSTVALLPADAPIVTAIRQRLIRRLA
jgi:8-oxo-dGTP diphosphatase